MAAGGADLTGVMAMPLIVRMIMPVIMMMVIVVMMVVMIVVMPVPIMGMVMRVPV